MNLLQEIAVNNMACEVWNIESISSLPAYFLACDHYRTIYISLCKPTQNTHKKHV